MDIQGFRPNTDICFPYFSFFLFYFIFLRKVQLLRLPLFGLEFDLG